jgi:hypothetical protein
MPAIILARRFARNELTERGSRPCLDLVDLKEYLAALELLDISIIRHADE